MHTWGRVTDEFGNTSWLQVSTDANDNNDAVYLTTLCQVLKLNLGESPMFANYGIPAMQTIMTQVFPDFYAATTQSQFAAFFTKCIIQRIPVTQTTDQAPAPIYNVNVQPHYGASIPNPLPI
jgi:hypothetical protein